MANTIGIADKEVGTTNFINSEVVNNDLPVKASGIKAYVDAPKDKIQLLANSKTYDITVNAEGAVVATEVTA